MAPFSIILVGEFCVTIYSTYENNNEKNSRSICFLILKEMWG